MSKSITHELADAQATIVSLTANLMAAQARVTELETAAANHQSALAAANSKAAEAEGKTAEATAKVTGLTAQLEAANKKLAEVEPTIESRASARAQEILAAAGAPPVFMKPKQNPAAEVKPGEGKTGLARVRAITAAQIASK